MFALDIGTRSVTGIILEKLSDTYSVVDYCIQEHEERSMFDGQIHHVVAVADVVSEVKKTLESRNGPLHQVCVAAAGRALKTVQAQASIMINQHPITDPVTVKHLELSAVQAAQQNLVNQENMDYEHYYCVGYSILHYKLDQERIGSLIDQNGNEASVEIIATFLPKVVVESLIAVLDRVGLEMEALTLEPIAAIQVLIPESMRRLNVALVDIGAGTSDIAITNQGTVVAYGMVPIAGDEITEAISDRYILDFPEAERTKRNIINHGEDTIQDILGFETTITYNELIKDIAPNIEKLAHALSTEILRLNKKAPQAVMLVGGGSLTPELTDVLEGQLQLPKNRVAVRGLEAVQSVTKHEQLPDGPDVVTPIGIAIAAQQNPVHYIHVTVNGKTIRLFELKQLTIGDGLIQAGIEVNKWYGKPGLAFMINVNGKDMTLPGDLGTPPRIRLNGERAHVDTPIQNGDNITIEKGKDGAEPNVTIDQLFGDIPPLNIYFNRKPYEIKPTIYVNQQSVSGDFIVKDKDEIVYKPVKTVADFFRSLGNVDATPTQPVTVLLNKLEVKLKEAHSQLYVNQETANEHQRLKDGDQIELKTAQHPTVKDLLEQESMIASYAIDVYFNGKPVNLRKKRLKIVRGKTELNEDSLLNPYDDIEVIETKTEPFIFQDVFRYVDIDLSTAKGVYQLYKNDHPTTFYEQINTGDQLKLEWKKSTL